MSNVGDIIEVDGEEYRIVDFKTEVKEGGETVTVTTTEPVLD